MTDREELSTSFGRAAGAYESGRPDYPIEAVAWLLDPVRAPDRSVRVADVGAGTGKLTRRVVELGAQVVAVDPDPEMLGALAEAVPGVPTFVGSAESLPLPDASLDAAVFGQAWHWVDVERASAEAGRVLRVGGVVGLIWNIRDDRDPWVRRLTAVMRGSHAEELIADGGPAIRAPFGPLEARQWEWSCSVTREALLDMVSSRSYVITATPDVREGILASTAGLFDERAAGASAIDLPYRTYAFRAVRGSGSPQPPT